MGSHWRKIRGGIVAVAVGVVGVGAIVYPATHGGGGGTPGTANLFVVASAGNDPCTRQSTATTFAGAASTAKCSSMEAALTASSSGDDVIVQGGTYGAGDLDLNGAITRSPRVTFSVASGATATMTADTVNYNSVSGATIDGTTGAAGQGIDIHVTANVGSVMEIGWGGSRSLTNFTVKGFKIHDNCSTCGGNALAMAYCGPNVLVSDFEIYNYHWGDVMESLKDLDSGQPCDGITLDRFDFHDVDCVGGNDDHQDGFQGYAGSNITLQNGRMHHFTCDAPNGGAQGWFPNPRDLDDPTGQNYSLINVVISDFTTPVINVGTFPGAVMENNTLDGALNGIAGSGVVFRNNLISDTSCAHVDDFFSNSAAGGYGHNVLGGACGHGNGDVQWGNWNSMFVNAAGGDYHLAPGSFAIDKGDPSNFPATDADGVTRPLGTAPDAGAYEGG